VGRCEVSRFFPILVLQWEPILALGLCLLFSSGANCSLGEKCVARLKAGSKAKGIKWDWEMQWWGEEGHALGKPAGIEREEGVNGRGGGCA
jgi:hypothetical protein